MTLQPGTYNWTQITDWEDDLLDRMSREALIWIDVLPDDLDTEQDDEPDYRAGLDSLLEKAVAESEDALGHSLKFREVDGGRGASYTALAIEVLGPIATVGGATAALVQAVRLVKWVYDKLASTTGYRPMISLGAAEHLATADLIDREHSEFHLLGSGDMDSCSVDRAFTGGDAFYVVFTTESKLHHYHVSAYGELFYIGTSPPIRDHWDEPPPYWTGGDPKTD